MTVCATCAREIIWLRLRDGSTVACDPTLRTLDQLPEVLGKTVDPNCTSMITTDGICIKKEFAQAGSNREGYTPHFYTCDVAPVHTTLAPLILDRLWLGGPASVAPAGPGEGGFGDGGELE